MSVTSGHETLATSTRTANQPNNAMVAVSIKPVHSVVNARSSTGLYICIQQSTTFRILTQCEFTLSEPWAISGFDYSGRQLALEVLPARA